MLCWFKSLDIHRACIMFCVCFYLKLILRINRFRICQIIVTDQDKAKDKNKLITNNFFRIQLRSWNCFGIFNLVRSAESRPWDNGGGGGGRSSRPLDKGGTRSPKNLFFPRVPPLAATGPFGHYRKKHLNCIHLNELYTWARDTVMWHWSADTLFAFDSCQLTITWMFTIKLNTDFICLAHLASNARSLQENLSRLAPNQSTRTIVAT